MTAVVYSFEQRKGGAGKTTCAVTCAVDIAQRIKEDGGTVLIVDTDPQGDTSRALGLSSSGRCISNVLLANDPLPALQKNVLSARTKDGRRGNLFVLPATDALAEARTQIISRTAANMTAAMFSGKQGSSTNTGLRYLLRTALAPALARFDYVIIDCPPTLNIMQQPTHEVVDGIIVPVPVDYHGTAATGRHTQNIMADREEGIYADVVAIVPTFVRRPLTNLSRAMLANLIKAYGKAAVSKPIPDTVRIKESPAKGITVLENDPDGDAADAFRHLTDRIIADANKRIHKESR